MVELCPTNAIWSNFAGAQPPVGYQKKWSGADPNKYSGHVTLWKQPAADGDHAVTVKMCSQEEAAAHAGSCSGESAAFYPHIHGSNACTGSNGDCQFMFVSDIWNGLTGDGGYTACMKSSGPSTRNCGFSVRNIRVQGPSFSGKCSVLNLPVSNGHRRSSLASESEISV
jgi:hypothetical protein